jgi:F0F1-type ATP synthase membrane subunit c/vacuolar-type H+-ATPase subunit K
MISPRICGCVSSSNKPPSANKLYPGDCVLWNATSNESVDGMPKSLRGSAGDRITIGSAIAAAAAASGLATGAAWEALSRRDRARSGFKAVMARRAAMTLKTIAAAKTADQP